MTKIYIVRHCEAIGNVNRIFQGSTDLDISESNVKMSLMRSRDKLRLLLEKEGISL